MELKLGASQIDRIQYCKHAWHCTVWLSTKADYVGMTEQLMQLSNPRYIEM